MTFHLGGTTLHMDKEAISLVSKVATEEDGLQIEQKKDSMEPIKPD